MQTPVQNTSIVSCRWTSYPIAVGTGVKSFKAPPTKKSKSWHGNFVDPGCVASFMLAEAGGDQTGAEYIAGFAAFTASLRTDDPTFAWQIAPPATNLAALNKGGELTFDQYFASYNHAAQVDRISQEIPPVVATPAAAKKSSFHTIHYCGKSHEEPMRVEAFPQNFLNVIKHMQTMVGAESGIDKNIGVTVGATGHNGEIKSFAIYDAGTICGDPCIAAEHELGEYRRVPANSATVYSRNMQRVEKSAAKKRKRATKKQKVDEPVESEMESDSDNE